MSVSWPGSMRRPRVKTPLLLLLLLSALIGTGQNEDDGELDDVSATPATDGHDDTQTSEAPQEVPDATTVQDPLVTDDGISAENIESSGSNENEDTTPTGLDTTSSPEEQEGLNPIIILIPVVLAVLIISMIVCCIFISRRWKKKDKCQELNKEDPYLDGTTSEKVPMPMFEEDVPSVLELEMEELGQWMQNEGETAEESANT